MTPRLSKLIDAILPRGGLALAVVRIGLLTLERDAAQAALVAERAQRAYVEHRLRRWRDALGDAVEQGTGPTGAAVRNILDE